MVTAMAIKRCPASKEFSNGDEEDGKEVPMDVNTPAPQAPSTITDTAMPSTSNDPTHGGDFNNNSARSNRNPRPGALLWTTRVIMALAAALASAIETRVLASPALAVVMAQMGQGIACDGDEEDKVHEEDYAGVMQGLHAVARIMSTSFEKASVAVQGIVGEALEKVIQRNRRFIEGASSTLM